MRWINRDPIEEDGGENVYSPCGNDMVERSDALGLKWVITRNPNRRWAVARRTSQKDTVEELSRILKLDASESSLWLRGSKTRKCKFFVPNVVCVYTSKSQIFDGVVTFVTHLKRKALSESKDLIADGYKVIVHKFARSNATFRSMWKEKGVYGIIFAGHGSVYGFVADSSSGTAIGPHHVLPPYRLALLHAYSCYGSADIPDDIILPDGTIPMHRWRDHVSSKGEFYGYKDKVNWLSAAEQLEN